MAGKIPSRGVSQKPPKPIKDKKHLAFIHELPCIVTNRYGVHAHHLRSGRYSMARKAGDDKTVPLVPEMHLDQYPGALEAIGETNFAEKYNLDLPAIALYLWENTGNIEACTQYILRKEWENEKAI